MKTQPQKNAPTHETSDDVQNDEAIGKALRMSLLGGLALLTIAAVSLAVGYYLKRTVEVDRKTEIALPEVRRSAKLELPKLPLTDITAEAGIDWQHVSGMEGEKLLPETMGGGVAIFDYNNDGHVDVLFVGGKSWEWAKEVNPQPRSLCLYQNDGSGKFADVTAEAGLDIPLYAMAPAIGDFDNDGWDDLYVTSLGRNYLFRNDAGKFRDITAQAGVAGAENAWSTGATWFDYDNDGRLDLFVCDYVVWSRELDQSLGFSLTGIGRAYGQPTAFTGTHSSLYHNDGDGKFSDVTKGMGIEVDSPTLQVPEGKGLAVVAMDVNHDGWTDLMVANDTVKNYLFINYEGKEFVESAIPMGVAFDRSGNATGAMGVDCGYLRNDESLAIAVGNFANEPSSLFMTRGAEPPFNDMAMPSGLGPVSRLNLTFGMFFADLDLDSRLDIVCSNGHLEAEISKVQSTQQYAQPPQYFWNAGAQGDTELVALTEAQVGSAAVERMVGRGAAYGDLDGDGDVDVILIANSGRPRVLRNDQSLGNNWVRLHLQGSGTSNRNAYGAEVQLQSGDKTQRRIVSATRSYLSQCEPTLTFGLGKTPQIDRVTIKWPDGKTQVLDGLESNQLHLIVQ